MFVVMDAEISFVVLLCFGFCCFVWVKTDVKQTLTIDILYMWVNK